MYIKINNNNLKNISLILITLTIVGLVHGVLGTAFANLTPLPTISLDDKQGPYYAVNNNGDLTIQVNGRITDIETSNCCFKLNIPDTFEISTLPDGKPIIEMLSNGSLVNLTVSDNYFEAVFALRTYNTTKLPRNYFLEISFLNSNFSTFVTPQWPDVQTGGEGAAISAYGDPYITSHYADKNTQKATKEHVKTYIYNPSNYYAILVKQLQYRLRYFQKYVQPPNIYWEDSTPVYSRSATVAERQTVVFHDYLSYIFTAPSGNKYALNHGDYKVTKVSASGTSPGGSWSDDYYPSTSQGEFNILTQTGTHPVFVVHLYDSAFPNYASSKGTTVLEWFNFIETWNFYYNGTTNLKTLFNIDFHSLIISWNPPSAGLTDLYYNYMESDAGEALGLESGEWSRVAGTDAENHGFDLLFATLGRYNGEDDHLGMVAGNQNMGIAMGGYYKWIFWHPIPIKNNHIDHTTIHEILHTYNADDLSFSGYIMTSPGSWDNIMYQGTYNAIRASRYDEPDAP
ncbi:MAG: hypothetical protein ACFFAU_19130 [Candidatus Hodarchaeota archaeon]